MANEPYIIITGNLTADPELKYVGSGTPVASFSVATTPRKYNRDTSSWEDGETMFFRCSVWREYAENVTESLAKGMRVVVTGRLQVRSFQRQDGSQGTSVEIQAEEVCPSLQFATVSVSRRGKSDVASGGPWQPSQPSIPTGNTPPWEQNQTQQQAPPY